VWAWDNYLIAQGLQKHGYYHLAALINKLLLDGVTATKRFPEYWRGDPDSAAPHQLNTQRIVVWDEHAQRENVVEQPPQDIQAWTVAAIYAIRVSNNRKSKNKNYYQDQPALPLERTMLDDIKKRSPYWSKQVKTVLSKS
jgi:glycogen debranching enzyme